MEKPVTSIFRVTQKSSVTTLKKAAAAAAASCPEAPGIKIALVSCLTELAFSWLQVTKSHVSYSFFY